MQSNRIPFLLVLIAAVIAMAPALFQGRIPAETDLLTEYGPWATFPYKGHPITSGGDSFLAFLPDRLVALSEWQAGRLPLWNPYILGGMPILGMQTANPLDPTIALLAILPTGFALGVTYTLLLTLGGWGMVLFLRELGIRSTAALSLGGVAFALNPYFLYWMELRVFLAGLIGLPFALWAIERLASRPGERRWIGVLGLSLGYAGLAGTLQTLAAFLLILFLRTLWRLRPSAHSGSAIRFLLPVGLGVLTGLAIGALPLVATLELLAHSTRTAGENGYYADNNFLSWRVIGLWFTPDLFGWPSFKADEHLPFFHRTVASSSGWGALGIVPLALTGFAWWRREGPDAERWFWTLLAGLPILGLVLALPFREALHGLWPSVDQVDLLRGLVIVNLAGVVLAARGIDALATAPRLRIGRDWILPWLLFGLLGVLMIYLAREGANPPHSFGHDVLPLGVVMAGVLVLTGVPLRWRTFGLVLLTAGELLRIHFLFNPFAYPGSDYPERAIVQDLEAKLGPPNYYRFVVPGYVRTLPCNTAAIYGLTDVRGYVNLPVDRYRTLLESAEQTTMWNKTYVNNVVSPVYRLLSARYYLLFFEGWLVGKCFQPVPGPTQVDGFFLRTDALPRAFLVHQVFEVAGEDQARVVLAHPGFNPGTGAILERGYPLPYCKPARGPESVTIVSYRSDRIEIQVEASSPGMLVLSDVFYPGWEATRDGASVPILPANWGVRGLAMDAGHHEVVFRYRPGWLMPGGVTMILGLAFALTLVAIPTRKRSRPRDPESP